VQNEALISDPEFAPFEGHWRRVVKTSLARTGALLVPVEKFANLGALLASLPPDDYMQQKYKDLQTQLKQRTGDFGPPDRKPEELKSVEVMAWICAVKFEWGKTGTNDFTVILSSNATAGASAAFMLIGVSGLPVVKAATASNPRPTIDTKSPDYAALLRARKQLVSLFPDHRLEETFYQPPRPIRVAVTGSMYFDTRGRRDRAPDGMMPATVWEIHPVSNLFAIQAF
jgi:hypothetical protein